MADLTKTLDQIIEENKNVRYGSGSGGGRKEKRNAGRGGGGRGGGRGDRDRRPKVIPRKQQLRVTVQMKKRPAENQRRVSTNTC